MRSDDYMTIKELIEELSKCDQSGIVVLSSDPEGNSYSPVYGVYKEQLYLYKGPGASCVIPEDDPDYECMDKEEREEEKDNLIKCVLVVPYY